MILSAHILARLTISLFGLLGFLIAFHIYKNKKTTKPFMCLAMFNCDNVVYGKHSKFFGTPLERMGMIYYMFTFLAYILLAFIPEPMPYMLNLVLVLYSLSAFLFSFYLLYLQTFVIKKGCTWCTASAFIALIIFILVTKIPDIWIF